MARSSSTFDLALAVSLESEKLDELFTPMARRATALNLAVEDVEGGKPRGRSRAACSRAFGALVVRFAAAEWARFNPMPGSGSSHPARWGWTSKRCQAPGTRMRVTPRWLARVCTLPWVASCGVVFKVVSRIFRYSSGVSTRRERSRFCRCRSAATPPGLNAVRALITVGRA